jgi:hypothetical protein
VVRASGLTEFCYGSSVVVSTGLTAPSSAPPRSTTPTTLPSSSTTTAGDSDSPPEPHYDKYEKQLAASPRIHVPTVTLDPSFDTFTAPGCGITYRQFLTGSYNHRSIDVGHNLPQKAPTDFAQAVIDADHL